MAPLQVEYPQRGPCHPLPSMKEELLAALRSVHARDCSMHRGRHDGRVRERHVVRRVNGSISAIVFSVDPSD